MRKITGRLRIITSEMRSGVYQMNMIVDLKKVEELMHQMARVGFTRLSAARVFVILLEKLRKRFE